MAKAENFEINRQIYLFSFHTSFTHKGEKFRVYIYKEINYNETNTFSMKTVYY